VAHWGKEQRQSRRGRQGGDQRPPVQDHHLAALNVGGHHRRAPFQVLKGHVLAAQQVGKQRTQLFVVKDAAPTAVERSQVQETRLLGEIDHVVQGNASRIEASHQPAHAGSDHRVQVHAGLLQGAQDADVRQAACAPPGKGCADGGYLEAHFLLHR
jgi:hypothetical protein